jgi:hypothetical protein
MDTNRRESQIRGEENQFDPQKSRMDASRREISLEEKKPEPQRILSAEICVHLRFVLMSLFVSIRVHSRFFTTMNHWVPGGHGATRREVESLARDTVPGLNR